MVNEGIIVCSSVGFCTVFIEVLGSILAKGNE
jgi:hypothetical protein